MNEEMQYRIFGIALTVAAIAAIWYLMRQPVTTVSVSAVGDDATISAPDIVDRSTWFVSSTPIHQSYNVPQSTSNTVPSVQQNWLTQAQLTTTMQPNTTGELTNLASVGLPESDFVM